MRQPRLGGALSVALLLALARPSLPASLGLRPYARALPSRPRAACGLREPPIEVLTAPPPPPAAAAPLGRPHTPESRAKISASNKGKVPWNNGRKHSAETIARIRQRTMEAMRARSEAKEAWLREHPEEAAELEAQAEARRLDRLRQQREHRAELRVQREAARGEAKAAAALRDAADAAARPPGPPPPRPLRPPRSPPSPQVRARIAETLRQRWQEPGYRAARSVAPPSASTRAKLSAAMRLRWRNASLLGRSALGEEGSRAHSAERRAKIAASVRERWLDPAYRNKTVSAIRSSARSRTPRAEHPEASGATETDGLALLLDDDDAPPGAAAWRSPRAAGARRGGSMRSRATPAKLGAHGLATASVDEALRRSARSHRNAAASAAAAKRAAARDQEDDDSPDGSDDSGADAEEDAEIQSAASRRRMRVTRAAAAAAAGLSLPDGGVDGHLDGLHAYGGGGLGPAVSGGGPMGEMPSSAPSTGLGAKAGDMLLSAPRRRGRPKGSGAGARQQQSAAQAAAAQLQLAAALRHSLAELEIEPLHTQLFPQGCGEESDFAQALLATLVSGAESSARLAAAQGEDDERAER